MFHAGALSLFQRLGWDVFGLVCFIVIERRYFVDRFREFWPFLLFGFLFFVSIYASFGLSIVEGIHFDGENPLVDGNLSQV
jgi:hypothetical protein